MFGVQCDSFLENKVPQKKVIFSPLTEVFGLPPPPRRVAATPYRPSLVTPAPSGPPATAPRPARALPQLSAPQCPAAEQRGTGYQPHPPNTTSPTPQVRQSPINLS